MERPAPTSSAAFSSVGLAQLLPLMDAPKAGTTNSAAVIKALRETNYKGLTGTTTFDDKRNPVREAIITSFDGLNYKVVESYSMS